MELRVPLEKKVRRELDTSCFLVQFMNIFFRFFILFTSEKIFWIIPSLFEFHILLNWKIQTFVTV